MTTKRPSSRSLNILMAAAILLSTLAVFWQVSEFEFINFDDPLYVTENQEIINGLSLDSLIWAFKSSHAGNWHPFTWLSHMLDCSLFGLSAAKHHQVNLLFHAANAILVFYFFAKASQCFWRSAILGLLFALHPLHVEPVVWVSERKELLSFFFMVLSLYVYREYTVNKKGHQYLTALILFATSLMCKPMPVSLPILLLLMDFWPFGRTGNVDTGQVFKKLLIEKIPFLALSLSSAIITLWAQQKSGALKSLEMFPFSLRLENALLSYLSYVYKTLWPADLLLPYPFPAEIPMAKTCFAALLLIAVSIAAWRNSRRLPYLFFGWFWFLISLLPVIGFVQVGVQAMADRYTYLPHLGLFVCLIWGSSHLLEKVGGGKKITILLVTILFTALASKSYQQSGFWRNSITLFGHAVNESLRNYTAHNYLALALAADNKLTAAESHYSTALKIKPDYLEAMVNLAVLKAGKKEYSEAFILLSQALNKDPDNPKILNNLANVVREQGRTNSAIKYYQQAITLAPNYLEANVNLAAALEKTGNLDESISQYKKVLNLSPDFAEAHNGLGISLAKSGRPQEAIASFQKALALRDDYEQAKKNLRLAEELLKSSAKKQ